VVAYPFIQLFTNTRYSVCVMGLCGTGQVCTQRYRAVTAAEQRNWRWRCIMATCCRGCHWCRLPAGGGGEGACGRSALAIHHIHCVAGRCGWLTDSQLGLHRRLFVFIIIPPCCGAGPPGPGWSEAGMVPRPSGCGRRVGRARHERRTTLIRSRLACRRRVRSREGGSGKGWGRVCRQCVR